MPTPELVDLDYQPVNHFYNRKQRIDRNLDELIGLAKGITADGSVNQAEAEYLAKWLRTNCEVASNGLALILFNRVAEMLEHGTLNPGEQRELYELLLRFTGTIPMASEVENLSCSLPLDDPPPPLAFESRLFCFTGKFLSATRRECEDVTLSLGGQCSPRVTQHLNYLVIGTAGSRDWAHTSFGRKIEQAVELKREGHGVHIIGEDYWSHHAFGINPD